MLKTIYFALGICLLLLADYAAAACPPALEQPAPEAVQAAMRNARDHGFLWRISKEGHTSYLYGTIHVAKFEWMFPGPQVTMAINASDTVALEMDMLDTNIQAEVSKGMAALHGAAMHAALEKRLRQQAAEFCVSYDAIANLSPELQVTALTMMVGRKAGLEAEYAIDAMLAGIAHREKKNVVSLETPELQLHVLQMDNEAETQAFVAESLNELEKGRALTMLERVAKAWASSDYAELEHYEDWCECLNTEIEREMMKRALDERNPALAEKIDALHKAGKQVFAAVGSLHMFGALGLPVLMEKLGYKVERVNLKRL
jgi:hypothetical protein